MIDIVIPKNNELDFIKIAQMLGYKELVFLYRRKEDTKTINTKFPYHKAIFSEKRIKGYLTVTDKLNPRSAIEKASVDLIFNQELTKKKDAMHFRYSGLNQVICKLMKEKFIIYAISFSQILNSKQDEQLIGRIRQNIKLCEKFKTKISIFSFAKSPFEMRAPKDLVAILSVLGANTKTQKANFDNLNEKILYNIKKSKGLIPENGVEILPE